MLDVPEPIAYQKCDHPTRELRRRTIANGTVVFNAQCLVCGSGKAVKRVSLSRADQAKAPLFDEGLADRWWQQQRERIGSFRQLREEERLEKDRQWWAWYNQYLRTPEWRQLRSRVLARSPICEGCGIRPAVNAHHATYERVGREMLFDLRAVCQQCHDQIHGERSC